VKRTVIAISVLFILQCACAVPPAAADGSGAYPPDAFEDDVPDLSAGAFALVDVRTGVVLTGHEIHAPMHPASLTKLMTLLLAWELGRGDERVPVGAGAAGTPGSSMGLRPGEMWSLESLLSGLMLPSGNDAGVALAEHLGGSVRDFARLMNQRATMLNMNDTHYVNPHGLTEEMHLSTAHDLAVLTAAVLAVPQLRQIASARTAEVQSLQGRSVQLTNTNRLLHEDISFKGVKTGTTAAAGRCLIAMGRSGGRELAAVILKSTDRYGDARRLLSWGFAQFTWETVLPSDRAVTSVAVSGAPGDRQLGIAPRRDLVFPVIDGAPGAGEPAIHITRAASVVGPVRGPLGEAVVTLGGERIYSVPLYPRGQSEPSSRVTGTN